MPVFQATKNIKFNEGYVRHYFFKGQPVRSNDKTFLGFISNHKHFVPVTNPQIIKIAPPLHLIKKVRHPGDMQKEEIIAELKQSGVNENPYQLHDTLALKLQTVRKMRPRNWITVLNDKGIPVFVDAIKLETKPVVEPIPDHTLVQYDPSTKKDKETQIPEPKAPVKKNSAMPPMKDIKLVTETNQDGNSAVVEKTDDRDIFDDGSYEDFLNANINNNTNPVVEPEKEVQAVNIILDEAEKAEEIQVEEEKTEDINQKIQTIDSWRYLVDLSETGKLYDNPVTEEEIENFKIIKKTKINIIVYGTFLSQHDVWEIEADAHNNKRWNTINKVTELLDAMSEDERTLAHIEINMLQRRFNDIEGIEPDYRKSTQRQFKRRLTMLSKFGIDISFDEDTDILRYSQTAFLIAKMGLQIPSTAEATEELLKKYENL
jgi:hypothetical protein